MCVVVTGSLVIIIKLSFNDAMNEGGKDVEDAVRKVDVDRPANEPRLLDARYRFGGSNRYRSGFLLLDRDRDRDRAPCWPPRPNRDEQPIDRDETEQHLPKS